MASLKNHSIFTFFSYEIFCFPHYFIIPSVLIYITLHNLQIQIINTDTDSLDNAGWNVDILHWDDFSKLLQTIHILDFTDELGAVTEMINVCVSNVLILVL